MISQLWIVFLSCTHSETDLEISLSLQKWYKLSDKIIVHCYQEMLAQPPNTKHPELNCWDTTKPLARDGSAGVIVQLQASTQGTCDWDLWSVSRSNLVQNNAGSLSWELDCVHVPGSHVPGSHWTQLSRLSYSIHWRAPIYSEINTSECSNFVWMIS